LQPAVRVADLVYDYPGGHRALNGVNLRIEPGERVALLGPNGAGKTTLALHLNGILRATSGQVVVAGDVVARDTVARVRSAVGLVFQDPDDQLFMPTVAQDVAFGPLNFGVPPAEVPTRVAEALAAVGMADAADAYPGHLSFGQRRRVAIATVLSCRPSVMVLDEPTSNLDPAARRELAGVVAALEVTVLMVTHDLPFALQLCPRSVILDEGQIRADGATRRLLADSSLLSRHRLELPFGFDPGVGTP
jgi:cobalt transport protein ATP-binding subunit